MSKEEAKSNSEKRTQEKGSAPNGDSTAATQRQPKDKGGQGMRDSTINSKFTT